MKKSPLVMCLTNTVAAEFTANALLAIGAKPAMVEEPSEAAALAGMADAVLINVGTVHTRQAEVMRAAIAACGNTIPWVLDPVACQLLEYRRGLVVEFLKLRPTLLRGNHAEVDFLLRYHPEILGSVPILSTGEVDRILGIDPGIEGTDPRKITGGVPMLQTVTATGCMQGALAAAYLGRGFAPVEAAVTVSRMVKRAGEIAWSRTKTPGGFRSALVDALWELEQERLKETDDEWN